MIKDIPYETIGQIAVTQCPSGRDARVASIKCQRCKAFVLIDAKCQHILCNPERLETKGKS